MADFAVDDSLATVVVKGLDEIVAVSFVELLKLRAARLTRFRDRILLPALADTGAVPGASPASLPRAEELDEQPGLADIDDTRGVVMILPLSGSIIAPLSRLKPEFRRDTDECWVLVDIDVRSNDPALPDQLISIGLDQSCRICTEQLVGVIDSGVDEQEADRAVISEFAVIATNGKLTQPLTPKDFHWNNSKKPPTGGWYHGSQNCARIAGEIDGVTPGTRLAVVAALTGIDADRRPTGTLAQFLIALTWLATTDFRGDPDLLGCDVINASLTVDPKSQRDYAALLYTVGLATRNNILIVCAVGANGNPAGVAVGPLAAHPSTLAVGALDPQLRFSNLNLYDATAGKPEICAPGPSTSLATPLVTGAAALLLARFPDLRSASTRLKEHVVKEFSVGPVVDTPQGLTTGRLMLEGICGEEKSVATHLRSLDPDAILSFTVQCRIPDPDHGESNFPAQLAELDATLESLKRPILAGLKMAGSIEVVDVPHTPFIVATARAAEWLLLMEPDGYLASHPEIVFLDNGIVTGAAGDETS